MNKIPYNMVFQMLGGRKFVAVLLVTLLTYLSIIWTFISGANQNAWNYITFVTPWYFGFVAAWAGLQIWQKKILNNS